ncbi:MAG: T9SS type A sorting domain-containing protein [Bacteroidales bacterium]|nr:T9SS type A sorting domain-containing protein [Bacteroidales bacterium]
MKKYNLLFVFVLIVSIGFSQVDKTILIEHYTNTKCGICASRNPAFYNLISNYPEVLHVSYHPSSPYPGCIFSMHNPEENDARTNYYGIYGGTPRVVLSGSVIPIASQLLTATQLEARLGELSNYAVEIEQYHGNNDTVNVILKIKKISGSSQDNLNLYAVLAEKEIMYNAPNGETTHIDVFRRVLVNEPVTLNNVGDSIVILQKYYPDPIWQEDEMFVVGVLQEVSSKEILQSAKSDIAGNIMFTNYRKVEELNAVVYPNPVSDQINFIESVKKDFIKAELFNIYGQKISESDMKQSIIVNGLPSGLYVLLLTDNFNRPFTVKVQKN